MGLESCLVFWLAEDCSFVTCSTLALYGAIHQQRHSENKPDFQSALKVLNRWHISCPVLARLCEDKLEFFAQSRGGIHWLLEMRLLRGH